MKEENPIEERALINQARIQKIDSWFIETRVHRCLAAECRHNMADVLQKRGTYCKYKTISIGMDGSCMLFEKRDDKTNRKVEG